MHFICDGMACINILKLKYAPVITAHACGMRGKLTAHQSFAFVRRSRSDECDWLMEKKQTKKKKNIVDKKPKKKGARVNKCG